MPIPSLLLSAACVLLPATPGESNQPRSILVLPVEGAPAGLPSVGDSIVVLLAAELQKHSDHRVTTLREIEGTLGVDVRRQIAGCDNSGCAAEIAGTLNAEEVIMGTLGKLGEQRLVLSFTRVQGRTGLVLARSVRTLENPGALPELIIPMAAELLGAPPPAAQQRVKAAPAVNGPALAACRSAGNHDAGDPLEEYRQCLLSVRQETSLHMEHHLATSPTLGGQGGVVIHNEQVPVLKNRTGLYQGVDQRPVGLLDFYRLTGRIELVEQFERDRDDASALAAERRKLNLVLGFVVGGTGMAMALAGIALGMGLVGGGGAAIFFAISGGASAPEVVLLGVVGLLGGMLAGGLGLGVLLCSPCAFLGVLPEVRLPAEPRLPQNEMRALARKYNAQLMADLGLSASDVAPIQAQVDGP